MDFYLTECSRPHILPFIVDLHFNSLFDLSTKSVIHYAELEISPCSVSPKSLIYFILARRVTSKASNAVHSSLHPR